MVKLLRVEEFRGRHTPPVIKPRKCTALSVNSPEVRQALREKVLVSAQWSNKCTAGAESTGEEGATRGQESPHQYSVKCLLKSGEENCRKIFN